MNTIWGNSENERTKTEVKSHAISDFFSNSGGNHSTTNRISSFYYWSIVYKY